MSAAVYFFFFGWGWGEIKGKQGSMLVTWWSVVLLVLGAPFTLRVCVRGAGARWVMVTMWAIEGAALGFGSGRFWFWPTGRVTLICLSGEGTIGAQLCAPPRMNT